MQNEAASNFETNEIGSYSSYSLVKTYRMIKISIYTLSINLKQSIEKKTKTTSSPTQYYKVSQFVYFFSFPVSLKMVAIDAHKRLSHNIIVGLAISLVSSESQKFFEKFEFWIRYIYSQLHVAVYFAIIMY